MNDNSTEHAAHILPLRVYLIVAALLLIATGLTVTIAQVDFGPWNLVVAMLIAGIKATLVAMFFMHLKYDNKLYSIVFVGAILFLAIFIVFTMFDTMRRGDLNEITARPIEAQAEMYKTAPFDSAEVQEVDSALMPRDTAVLKP
jgi:cytochrome c oxidase subunit 4